MTAPLLGSVLASLVRMPARRRFGDVPPGRNSIRISDANACDENSTGAVTARAVFANGVLLTEIVDTPGSGIEPGFGFSVDASGLVTP